MVNTKFIVPHTLRVSGFLAKETKWQAPFSPSHQGKS